MGRRDLQDSWERFVGPGVEHSSVAGGFPQVWRDLGAEEAATFGEIPNLEDLDVEGTSVLVSPLGGQSGSHSP